MEPKKLTRSRNNRWLGGVIGGFAAYLGVDATLLRILAIIGLLITGLMPGALLYAIGWVIMPQDGQGAM